MSENGVKKMLTSSLLSGDNLKLAADRYANELLARVRDKQHGVPTFFDNYYLSTIQQLKRLDPRMPWEESVAGIPGIEGEHAERALYHVRLAVSRNHAGRYVEYQLRMQEEDLGLPWQEVDDLVITMSQGVQGCMQWKGEPLFKTAYDFSLYTMLIWELKPGTIIELGSGSGASAVWMADLMRMFDVPGEIISADWNLPSVTYAGVRFLQGDIRNIEQVVDKNILDEAPHPWLIVEDAHVNLFGVLQYFHQYLNAGDYLIIEDSESKQEEISAFLEVQASLYKVDTYYSDFFGRNVSSAPDSILVRQ